MLLLHDTLMVMDDNPHQHNHHPHNHHTNDKGFKARKVFLFEQMIIFSEEHKRNNLSNSAYLFKHSIMVTFYSSPVIDAFKYGCHTDKQNGDGGKLGWHFHHYQQTPHSSIEVRHRLLRLCC